MTHDKYKAALDDAKDGWIFHPKYNQAVISALQLAQEAEQLRLKLSETVIHLAARNTEIEQLRKERDELADAVVRYKKGGWWGHADRIISTYQLAKKESERNGNA